MKNTSDKIIRTAKCQEIIIDGSPCDRQLYDEKHCIFHSHKFPKIKDGFNEAFWKEFERQKKEDECYDFSGFIFPDSISFEEIKFDKDVYFDGAHFTGKVTFFRGAKFSGNETSFSGAKFTGNETSFSVAEFTAKVTNFSWAEFTGMDTSFIAAKFTGEKTSFESAQFTAKWTYFIEAQFTGNEISFREAEFKGEKTYFGGAIFTCEVTLYNAVFKNVWGLFESLTKEKKWLFLKTKKYLIKDWRFYLQEETANRHPLIKRMVNDAWYLDEFKLRYPIWYKIWKILADCGRSWLRWAAWAMGVAFAFGLIFMAMGPNAFELRHGDTGFSFIYYSIVTFTTLGFGDITPKTLTAEIFVTAEVLLGYIMLGGLISIFATRFARRS